MSTIIALYLLYYVCSGSSEIRFPIHSANIILGFSFIILSCFAGVHLLLPQHRSVTTKLFKIAYHNPTTDLYGKGEDDIYFVFFWIVMFTFLRATAMDYIFTPLARRGGVSTKKGLIRFAEQAWLLVYYSVFWTLGMVCHSSTRKLYFRVGNGEIYGMQD